MAKPNSSLLVFFFVLSACTMMDPPLPAENAVAVRLARYTELLRRQDAAELSAMFEPAGSLGHKGQPPIVGRDKIKAFLRSFANYKVLAHDMHVSSVVAQGNEVIQNGTYAQQVLTPEGRRIQVSGTFTAVWHREKNGEWLIETMRTAPPVEA